ncbi:polymer-forming cytoskeletal protein [Rhodanobacter sp. 115]|uniref:bactofilin family protein n=1 Tax=Rhodanobacter sp. FW021-MT20 TaxID=1162282 RepID=UPI0034E59597
MANLLALIMPKRTATKTVTHAPPMAGKQASRQSNHLAIKTVIAAGAVVEGDLRLNENIIINGVVQGDVIADGCLVLIKETGLVTGVVRAAKVYLAGEVRGGVLAKFLRLFPTARVTGSISTHSIVVDMGASLHCSDISSGGVTVDQQQAAAPAARGTGVRSPEESGSESSPVAVTPIATRRMQAAGGVDHSRSEHGIGTSALAEGF